MSAKANKETARRWIVGLWDDMNFGLLTLMATADYTYNNPGTGDLGGPACVDLVKTMHGAFPDLHNTVEDQIAEGARVVTWGTTRGTHQGAFAGIPATGKSIAVQWVIITELRGGKVARDREIYDSLGLMKQIGVP
jgi:steroid delta-isomerase-like uncharacterized protein